MSQITILVNEYNDKSKESEIVDSIIRFYFSLLIQYPNMQLLVNSEEVKRPERIRPQEEKNTRPL
jgi:hypothetical protein